MTTQHDPAAASEGSPRRVPDLATARERLRQMREPAAWRSLDEIADDPQLAGLIAREFPHQASELPALDATSRRGFLQLTGASLALAGLTGCTRQPLEKIVPYVKQPEEFVPGKPLFYASAGSLPGGYGVGLLVESHAGRPTKIEGNPDHPASLGATDAATQAAVLDLYDPDRSQNVLDRGELVTFEAFKASIARLLEAQKGLEGSGLRVLTGAVTSPSLAAQIDALRATYPQARWVQWDAAGRHSARAAAGQAFGGPAEVHYDLDAADVIVTLDADLLVSGPGAVRYARDFARRRRVFEGGTINRLYAIESTPTLTGTQADHRLALAPAQLGHFALALAAAVGVPEVAAAPSFDGRAKAYVDAIAADLQAAGGRSLVVAGEEASAALHVLAMAINARLGSLGTTVRVTDPVEVAPVDQVAVLTDLVAEMRDGKVDLLLMIGVNPVYDAPADLDFAAALERVRTRVHVGVYQDETAERCQWHVNQAHDLEAWGDSRAFDGTVTLRQPLIEPLYGGKTAAEIMALFAGTQATAEELVKGYWTSTGGLDEKGWRRALHDGLLADSALPVRGEVALDAAAVSEAAAELAGAQASGITVLLRPDPSLGDGRQANNGWLQELPKPFTRLTWDNAALLGPALAERLGVDNESLIEVEHGGTKLALPVWVVPGQAAETITVHLGFGRWRAGRVGNAVGVNTYQLRRSTTLWRLDGAQVRRLDGSYRLASTQHHHVLETGNLEGREAERRELVHVVPVGDLAHGHVEVGHHYEESLEEAREAQLFADWEYPTTEHAWAMAIDLSSCTGCNACVIACQAENNIPVVGKAQVLVGREMQWLRIDRYYFGDDLDDLAVHHQPLPCMQCEKAPCEVVCPVAATVHSAEGLNDMVYNRCVGTRYCANNCPYKVRRFNFLKFNDYDTPVLDLLRNPDVTVRFRGVMEKCTYCVQRINGARIEAKKENRKVREGEVVTACQQACPSEAIAFGDLHDHASRLAKRREQPHHYGLLAELDTRPRTTYLAKLRNPNPALETA